MSPAASPPDRLTWCRPSPPHGEPVLGVHAAYLAAVTAPCDVHDSSSAGLLSLLLLRLARLA